VVILDVRLAASLSLSVHVFTRSTPTRSAAAYHAIRAGVGWVGPSLVEAEAWISRRTRPRSTRPNSGAVGGGKGACSGQSSLLRSESEALDEDDSGRASSG
jgi:hypothetical protein